MDLPKRKSNRLHNYDYSQNGAYFITICVKHKCEILWNVGANIVRPCGTDHLTEYGAAIEKAISVITEHYPSVLIDNYVIMPNHIHLLILLSGNDGRTKLTPNDGRTKLTPNDGRTMFAPNDGRTMFAPTISRVIKQMKENVTKQIGFSLWQKSFHDHIIRDDREYQKIWEYINTNPLTWELDCLYGQEKAADSAK